MSSGITILIVFRLRAENGTKNLHNFVIALLCSIRYNDWVFSIALLQICKTQQLRGLNKQMSASREKKSRQENLAGGYVDPRTKREKDEQAKDRRSNALYIAIAVIFVIVGIVVTVANSKVIERSADAVTIGNETYTAADVSYFYNTIYSSFVSKNSYYLSVYGLDTSKSLKEQDCPINGSTWYDYFRDQALESLKSYALLAQKAEAEGFDGSEAVEQSVQDTFCLLYTSPSRPLV